MEDEPLVSLRSVLGTQGRRSWRGSVDGRALRVALAVVVIAAGILVGAGVGRATPPPPPRGRVSAADVTAPAPSRGAPATTSSTVAVRLWPAPDLRVDGRHVATDDGRWEVGAEGDVVVVGDWDCDRLATPAVLRPTTGEVAVFDRWADEEPEPARAVATLAGVTEVRTTERCGELLARGPAGEHLVDTRPVAS